MTLTNHRRPAQELTAALQRTCNDKETEPLLASLRSEEGKIILRHLFRYLDHEMELKIREFEQDESYNKPNLEERVYKNAGYRQAIRCMKGALSLK